MKKNIYLVQVNNTFGRNAFLPYSVGLLWAYCNSFPEISDNYQLKDFIYFRNPIEEHIQNLEEPEVVGFSFYIWNWRYTLALAEATKKAYPNALIVAGGPQVPLKDENFFKSYPFIDILVHSEGELAFHDILMEHKKPSPDFSSVAGISISGADNERVDSAPRERNKDLSSIPSPYLDGYFDSIMLDKEHDFHVSQETHRGCPYSCTFCDWGSATFTKVRKFDDDKLRKEILWFAKNNIDLLYNCDANFGLFPRDQEFIDFLISTKAEYGFPNKFRAAYAKKNNTRVFDISKQLNEAGMSKGATLSLQSLDPEVLKAVARTNISMDDFADTYQKYQAENIPTYTELILGLPGESYGSFADGIDTLLTAGLHNGLNVYPCILLPNSSMSTPDARAEYDLVGKVMPIMLLHANPPVDGFREENEVVIQTNTMPTEQWCRSFIFSWFLQALHSMGILQYIARYCYKSLDISYREFYESLLDETMNHESLLLTELYNFVSSLLDGVLGGGLWDIVLPEFGQISWPPEEVLFLKIVTQKERFYQEISLLVKTVISTQNKSIDSDLLNELLKYQEALLVSPKDLNSNEISTDYDFSSYFSSELKEQIEKKKSVLSIAPHEQFKGDLMQYAQTIVWYGRKGGSFLHQSVGQQNENEDTGIESGVLPEVHSVLE